MSVYPTSQPMLLIKSETFWLFAVAVRRLMQSQAPSSVMSPGVSGVFWDVGTSDAPALGDPAEVDQGSACVLAALDSDLASLSGTTWRLSWFCCRWPPTRSLVRAAMSSGKMPSIFLKPYLQLLESVL